MGHKTGLEDYYIIKNNRKMRFGYTTGSCAAAAAKGAAEILLGKQKIKEVETIIKDDLHSSMDRLETQTLGGCKKYERKFTFQYG